MANWTENDLKRQFERAKKNGWIKTFKSAAATYQFPPEVLMAIASRETNMRNIIGDGGHGYGLMQIDDRSFPEWCNSGFDGFARAYQQLFPSPSTICPRR